MTGIEAHQEVSELATREGGLLHLIFDVEYHPVLLPEHIPPDVMSAWCRLAFGAVKDLGIIQRWLDSDQAEGLGTIR